MKTLLLISLFAIISATTTAINVGVLKSKMIGDSVVTRYSLILRIDRLLDYAEDTLESTPDIDISHRYYQEVQREMSQLHALSDQINRQPRDQPEQVWLRYVPMIDSLQSQLMRSIENLNNVFRHKSIIKTGIIFVPKQYLLERCKDIVSEIRLTLHAYPPRTDDLKQEFQQEMQDAQTLYGLIDQTDRTDTDALLKLTASLEALEARVKITMEKLKRLGDYVVTRYNLLLRIDHLLDYAEDTLDSTPDIEISHRYYQEVQREMSQLHALSDEINRQPRDQPEQVWLRYVPRIDALQSQLMRSIEDLNNVFRH